MSNTPYCSGNSSDHCCYLNGPPCHFLEENTVEGRRWACGLRRELGSWDAVYADQRYIIEIQPVWEQTGLAGYKCGEWPAPGFKCGQCGLEG